MTNTPETTHEPHQSEPSHKRTARIAARVGLAILVAGTGHALYGYRAERIASLEAAQPGAATVFCPVPHVLAHVATGISELSLADTQPTACPGKGDSVSKSTCLNRITEAKAMAAEQQHRAVHLVGWQFIDNPTSELLAAPTQQDPIKTVKLSDLKSDFNQWPAPGQPTAEARTGRGVCIAAFQVN